VLAYYAIANASALTLRAPERRWPRALAVAGLGGCVLLAISLPLPAVLAGAALLVAGAGAYAIRQGAQYVRRSSGRSAEASRRSGAKER